MFIGLMASQTARKLFIPLLPLPLLPPPPLPLPLHTPHQLRHQHHHPSRPPHPHGVSGSPAFLPGRSPNHLGRRALGRLVQSSYLSFHIPSSISARTTSQPPSYSF